METIKINLTIEKGEDHMLWGSLSYNDNLIIDYGEHIPELETNLKRLLEDLEGMPPEHVEFIHHYDLYALFKRFDYLKISSIAKYAGMNAALLRQYASGVKNPSLEQAKRIEKALHILAEELREVSIV